MKSLKIKEKRFYYSTEPINTKTETNYYDIKIGERITSNCILISDLIINENEVNGINIKYYNDDTCKEETKEVLYGTTTNICIIVGNSDKYFVYDYAIEIVNTVLSQ